MNLYDQALRDTPAEVTREITRFGGLNPFGRPQWRVVLAQNVLIHTFGTRCNMPAVSADADIEGITPESWESGEFFESRYPDHGWILEKWFPADTWGDRFTWEDARSLDGETRMMGEFPRQGDYYQITVEGAPFARMPNIGFWKDEITKFLRELIAMPGDPVLNLSNHLYLERTQQKLRYEAFLEEVNAIHRSVVEPLTMSAGRTAQRVRDDTALEIGYQGHIAAG